MIRDAAERVREWAPSIVLVVLLVVGWAAAVAVFDLPAFTLPKPTDVVARMFGDAGYFLTQAVPTVTAIVFGFLAALALAVPLAIFMVYNDIVRRAVYPLVLLSQLVPKVAIAPLFILWFGFGQSPKILLVALISFFPILINSIVGFQAVRPESLMLVRSMGASRWQAFRKIRWPWALPSIFGGAKVAATLSVVGAIVAEFVGANKGLGIVLINARGALDSTTVFAAIGWLTILGFLLFGGISLLERLLVRGARSSRTFEGAGRL